MRPMPELEVVNVPTNDLVEYANNAKLHPSDQVDQIAASIEKFGFNSPILAWHNDEGEPEIVAGHGRLMAARKLGLEELPVVFLDHMSEEQRRAYILIDNQLTMNSGFDTDILDAEIARIASIDMADFGFDVDLDTLGIDDIDLWPEFQKDDIFATELGEANNYVVLKFDTAEDWERAIEKLNLEEVVSLDKNPNVRRSGIGRVIDGASVLERLDD